jgi:hypothetical protein
MRGNKRTKHRKTKRSKQPKQEEASNWYTRLALGWRILIFALGVPGLYLGILGLLPKVSVTPGELVRDYDPFSVPFVVSNDGPLPMHDVQTSCGLESLMQGNLRVSRIEMRPQSEFRFLGDLGSGGRATTFCGGFIIAPNTPKEAKLSVQVSFRPDFLPFHTSHTFFFRSITDRDGRLRYIENPN